MKFARAAGDTCVIAPPLWPSLVRNGPRGGARNYVPKNYRDRTRKKMWAGRRPRCVDFREKMHRCILTPQNGFVKTQKKAFGKRANNPDVAVSEFLAQATWSPPPPAPPPPASPPPNPPPPAPTPPAPTDAASTDAAITATPPAPTPPAPAPPAPAPPAPMPCAAKNAVDSASNHAARSFLAPLPSPCAYCIGWQSNDHTIDALPPDAPSLNIGYLEISQRRRRSGDW